jgi:hypothetical protein
VRPSVSNGFWPLPFALARSLLAMGLYRASARIYGEAAAHTQRSPYAVRWGWLGCFAQPSLLTLSWDLLVLGVQLVGRWHK